MATLMHTVDTMAYVVGRGRNRPIGHLALFVCEAGGWLVGWLVGL
jgi:hypothetical protein